MHRERRSSPPFRIGELERCDCPKKPRTGKKKIQEGRNPACEKFFQIKKARNICGYIKGKTRNSGAAQLAFKENPQSL